MAITPPFKPAVESDESTSNFDPEFTEADIKGVVGGLGGDYGEGKSGRADDLDEDDPSERWVERSLREGGHSPGIGQGVGGYSYHNQLHLANGPLGSDRLAVGGMSTAKGIDINRGGKKKDGSGVGVGMGGGESPLTKSVQEHFRGFTYHGESVWGSGGLHGVMASRGKNTNAEQERAKESEPEEEGKGAMTEEEYEDFEKSAGRFSEYTEKRRKESTGENRASWVGGDTKVKKEKKKVKIVGFVVNDEKRNDEGELDVDGMVPS